jgi:DNA-binding FadR family transcriptional regulator
VTPEASPAPSDRVAAVTAQLEELILSQGLKPGDKLPAERDLSARLEVSRSVVREAMGRLQSVGRIVSRHGSGSRVAAPSGRQVTAGYEWLLKHQTIRLEDLAEVRLPLETAIVAQAVLHRTPEQLAALTATQLVLSSPERTLEEQIAADIEFHSILADATGNPIFTMVLRPIQQLLIESRRRTLGEFGAQLAHEHHARILQAVAAQDAAAAVAAMRFHLEVNRDQLATLHAEVEE